jgi:hypothetical protein
MYVQTFKTDDIAFIDNDIIIMWTWPPHAILVSDWSISKKSSPLKLLSHMNRNLVGSIYMYGRFCIFLWKNANVVTSHDNNLNKVNTKSGEWAVMYMCVRGNGFACFYMDFAVLYQVFFLKFLCFETVFVDIGVAINTHYN